MTAMNYAHRPRTAWFRQLRVLGAFFICSAALADESGKNQPMLPVRCLAFSPDGRTLAASAGEQSGPGIVVVWDTTSLKARFEHREPVGVRSLAYAPDGTTLILGRYTPDVLAIDADSGRPIRTLVGHEKNVLAVAYLPRGNTLITADADGTVFLWDPASGKTQGSLSQPGGVRSVAVSPDGKRLAMTAAGPRGAARLWDLATLRPLHTFDYQEEFVSHASFSPDGRWLALSTYAGYIVLHDAATWQLWMSFRNGGGAYVAAFSPDGRWLAGAFGSSVAVYRIDRSADEPTKKEVAALVAKFNDDSYALREAAHRALADVGMMAEPQLRTALSSESAEVRWRSRKLLSRLGEPESAIRLAGHQGDIACLSFSPDGRVLASGDDRGVIRIVSVGDWKLKASLTLAAGTAPRR